MTKFRNTALAALLALGTAAGTAQAQFYVDATTIPGQAPGATGNVVGGGVATMIGGGDDRVIVYSAGGAGAGGGAVVAQPGRLARLTGGAGDGPQVEYLAPAPAGRGRTAVLIGGGEDREVVYLGTTRPDHG
ncbi:MAG: hypothetical protein IRZ13_00205 [Acetobacteraceae bacterium]|nr:hypothetical protein [Acetobacteraceae bacterium]